VTGATPGRDGYEVEALVTDRYLEALLAAHARGADRGPTPHDPDDALRRTADRLARDLPRFHPSFLFEEALAARLGSVAARMRMPAAAGAEGVIVPLPVGDLLADMGDPFADRADAADGAGPAGSGRRPLIIGGALTSAALSLAGAAFVAWRMNRPAGPMVRAARAVARTRPI
jgi:hypothetical protein